MSVKFETIEGSDVPPVAPAGKARIYFDSADDQLKFSENTGPYVPFGAESQITVVDGPALAAYPIDAGMTAGTDAYMTSVESPWTLTDSATAPAPDGITVIAASSGPYVWERSPVANVKWASQLAWEQSDATGSDFNTGAPGSPLKTLAEHCRRMGSNLATAQMVVVSLDTPDPTDTFNALVNLGSNFPIIYQGAITTVSSGNVIAGIVQLDRGVASVQCSITYATAAADLALNRRIRLTSGLEIGKMAWLKSNPGGGRVNLGCFMSVDALTGTYLLANPLNILDGDTYDVEECLVYPAFLEFLGTVYFDNASIDTLVYFGSTAFGVATECSLFFSVFNGPIATQANCKLSGGYLSGGSVTFYGGVSTGQVTAFADTSLVLDADFQSTRTVVCAGILNTPAAGVFDSTSQGIVVQDGGDCYFADNGGFGVNALYGSANTSQGVFVQRNAKFQGDTAPTITGTTGDVAIRNVSSAVPWQGATQDYGVTRAMTWASLVVAVNSGGFGNAAFSPAENASVITSATPDLTGSGIAGAVANGATLTVTTETVVPCVTIVSAVTVNLPPATLGRKVSIKDTSYTAGTNNITINAAGADVIEQLVGADAATFVIAIDRTDLQLECILGSVWNIM